MLSKKIIILLLIFIIILSSGCLYIQADSTWEELIDSYDARRREFVDFEGYVRVEGNIAYISRRGSKTEVRLESKPNISVYITESIGENPEDGDLTRYYDVGDNIMFQIEIVEDEKYGEYIKEMNL